MSSWLDHIWDQQVGLDEYLPGTPRKGRNLLEHFPYHIWGRSYTVGRDDSGKGATDAERKFRRQDAIRRRQFPSCFEEACAYGNLEAVILMWSQGTVDVSTRRAVYEGNNASSLMWAAFKGHLAIVRFLVDHGAPLDAANTLGHTALQWAITSGHHDVVRFLLDQGADPSHRDRQGFDAAFSAVQNDQLAMLLMLTEDAGREGNLLEARDHGTVFYQPTPEQCARASTTVNQRTGKPFYLLDPNMRDVEGHTLMHWAAYRNSPAACHYLLDHWGFAADAQDKHGRTPLVWAAREGYAEVMEVLLARGADRTVADSDGWTALQHARNRNHPEAVYVLESYVSTGNPARNAPREGEDAQIFSDSAKAALLEKNNAGSGRYVSVRERRAMGTLQMIRTHTIYAIMAAAGPLYLFVTYLVMNVLSPVLSYFPFGLYFFKNVVWTSMTPRLTQSSVSAAGFSVTKTLGIAATIQDSVRGTWLFRMRDPSTLFLWVTFVFVQVGAWNALGLPPLFSITPLDEAARSRLWETPVLASAPPSVVHLFGLSFLRCITFRANPLSDATSVTLPAAAVAYMAQSATIVRVALTSLLVLTLVNALLCKLFATRHAVIRASEEGTMRTSPLWRILSARRYRWLHPRFFLQERHMQVPVRAFYCHERDVFVRGYDGYSYFLDCPIGQGNHRFFVLMLTCFTLFEVLLMVWGLQLLTTQMHCPSAMPFYADAFFAFQSSTDMAATLVARRGAVGDAIAAPPSAAVASAVASPIISFAWLRLSAEVFLHGLPCRHQAHLDRVTRDYLLATSSLVTPTKANTDAGVAETAEVQMHTSRIIGYMRRFLFMIQYYLLPTRAAALGLWVLHYSFLAAFSMGCVAVRQWVGVWRGATRMELANPLAPGEDGELVCIFPKDLQQAQRFRPIVAEEERYYAATCPQKARPVDQIPEQGTRSIFADGRGFTNVLYLLLGKQGLRWRGAMAVSSHNAPVKVPMLM